MVGCAPECKGPQRTISRKVGPAGGQRDTVGAIDHRRAGTEAVVLADRRLPWALANSSDRVLHLLGDLDRYR